MSVEEIDRNDATEVNHSSKELGRTQEKAQPTKTTEANDVKTENNTEDDFEGLPLEDAEKHDDDLSPYDFME